MPPTALGNYLAYTFGAFCILSAPPFIGIPFPTKKAATYYESKTAWMSDLSGGRLSPRQAAFLGASQRVIMGLALISTRWRRPTCALMGVVISYGTYAAIRDGRPLLPQVGMLGALAAVALLG